MMIPKSIENLLADAVAIEEEEAREAGMIGYMARAMVQATMPYRDPKTVHFQRVNGNFTLTMTTLDPKIGLPYGSIPRLVMAWIGREAVRTQNRTLVLGSSLSDFLKELDLYRTGGKRGDITRLRNQMIKLFASAISANYNDPKRATGMNMQIASNYNIWWDNKVIDQAGLWESTVKLGEDFYNELVTSPIPVDMRALKALKSTPMAIDLYTWLTYRNSYLKKPTLIRWESMQMQFGADYTRTRAFKEALVASLKKVSVVYPEAKVGIDDKGLILSPSNTHILAL
jgi:hypothetical protein